MKYLSVCSGIEAASVAWHDIFEPVAFSEIEPFPCAVLKHHYPSVPNWVDMTKFKEWHDETVDILVGGTPCQSFSVAGLRKGLEDPRGNLMLTFLGIADKYKPKWIVWENVPGVLSSGKGRDFGTFLGALAELGYGWAYRVLDAQNFGVPQRRRRVFVVGCLGNWRSATSVLFESESLCRDTPKSRKTGQEVTETSGTLASSSGGLTRPAGNANELDFYVVSPALRANANSSHRADSEAYVFGFGGESETFVRQTLTRRMDGSPDGSGRGAPIVAIPIDMRNAGRDPEKHDAVNRQGCGVGSEGDPAPTVNCTHVHAAAFTQNQSGDVLQTPVCPSMGTNQNATGRNTPKVCYSETGPGFIPSRPTHIVLSGMQVRRLTPRECERLQGFPDDYTLIPRTKLIKYPHPAFYPDGPRYKALGNSMAVPVMRWIGQRIKMFS